MHRFTSQPRFTWLALVVGVVGVVGVAGCDSGAAEARAGTAGVPPAAGSSAAPSAAPARGGGDAFEVIVAGAHHAGTHRGSGTLGCMVYNGLWQATWEAPEETGLSALMLQLKEVPASGGSSTKLSFTAVFGSQVVADAVTGMMDVHGSEFGRDGRGMVTREGKGAVIRVEGTAQQGARVTAVLRCASVDVMS
ncbi:MAG: hypothetical protein H0X64_10525 [Gemmatimonadaceae bacterium]|nr:hypothetical protein [Gemmatimonadaceae bacterium]